MMGQEKWTMMPGVPELVIIGLICLGLVVVPLLVVLLVVFVWAKESGSRASATLIPCPRCNHKVSPSASSCPSCGEPLTTAKPEP